MLIQFSGFDSIIMFYFTLYQFVALACVGATMAKYCLQIMSKKMFHLNEFDPFFS